MKKKPPLNEIQQMHHLIDEIGTEKYDEFYKSMYDLECLGCLVFRANRLMVNQLRRRFKQAGHDITVEQFQILLHLWEEDGLSQTDLVTCIKKDKAGLARTLDIMERKMNLILRITSDTDRRQRRVYLTNKGKELKDILAPLAIRQHLKYLSILGEDKVETAQEILKQLVRKLGQPD